MDIPSEELWNKSRIPLRIATGVVAISSAYVAHSHEAPHLYFTAIAMAGLFAMTFLKWKEPATGIPPGEMWRRIRLLICMSAGVFGAGSVYVAYHRGVPAFYLAAVVMALLFLGTLRKWRK